MSLSKQTRRSRARAKSRSGANVRVCFDEHYVRCLTFELKLGIFYFSQDDRVNRLMVFGNVFYMLNRTNIDLMIKSSKKSNFFFFFKKHQAISSNDILSSEVSINNQTFIIKSEHV